MNVIKSQRFGYSIRKITDNILETIVPVSGYIKTIYNTSFDVKANGYLFNFNTDESRLHPLSVLIDETILNYIHPETRVRIDKKDISIGQIQLHLDYIIPDITYNHKLIFLRPYNLKILNSGLKISKKLSSFFDDIASVLSNIKIQLKNRFLDSNEYIKYFGGGDGLTPSFDDFFTGLIFTDRVLHNNYIKADEYFFKTLFTKTTLPSFYQLKFASQGKLSLLFERFMNNFLYSKINTKEVLMCMNTGHSSGTNILYGINFYFTNCAK
ncbi:MAG: DUF2877 domain-containing protein [Candidatus Hydrogenedentota bacterium]